MKLYIHFIFITRLQRNHELEIISILSCSDVCLSESLHLLQWIFKYIPASLFADGMNKIALSLSVEIEMRIFIYLFIYSTIQNMLQFCRKLQTENYFNFLRHITKQWKTS